MIDMDEMNQIGNVLWAETHSRAAYEYFDNVTTFDTTYLTNIYKM